MQTVTHIMQPLRPLDIPLAGKNLIQASAGTGKTWTISLLYLRLIIEQQLTVDQLLVVTYTRAATEELRERIRARLKRAVALYEVPQQADEFEREYRELLERYPADDERLWYLRRALLSFDEAAVFTIHGFCQRALQENAFEVGLPFDSELTQDETELQLALADRFWQQRMLDPHPLDQAVLEQHSITPDSLLQDVRSFIGRPYLHIVRPVSVSIADYTDLEQRYITQLQATAAVWQAEQAAVLGLMDAATLNQQVYKPAQLEAAVAQLETLFGGSVPGDWEKTLYKFTPDYLAAKTKKGRQTPEHAFSRPWQHYCPCWSSARPCKPMPWSSCVTSCWCGCVNNCRSASGRPGCWPSMICWLICRKPCRHARNWR
ncbi:MAG: UvrD-helicase domain-containing protein [Thiolinea sp.]